MLLLALGVTVFISYRMNRTPNPAVVQAEAPKPVVTPPVQTDARVRLDLLNKQSSDDDLGKKNLFQYGPPPAPPAPAAPSKPVTAQNPMSSNPNANLSASIPNRPAPPPPI